MNAVGTESPMTLVSCDISSSNQELHMGSRAEKQKIRKMYHAGGQEDQLQRPAGGLSPLPKMGGTIPYARSQERIKTKQKGAREDSWPPS